MRQKTLVAALIAALFVACFSNPSVAASEPICTITGTSKADRLVGTSADDVICAGSGNDTVLGLGGNDIILAGPGNDKIFGGVGDDQLSGGTGNDSISAGVGNDTVTGEAGKDSISGGTGSDTLAGGEGRDRLAGNSGEDILRGELGNDRLSGGTDADILDGGTGADTIVTGTGSDMCSLDASDIHLDACTMDSTGPQAGVLMTDVLQFSAGSTAVFNVKVLDESGTGSVYGKIGGAPGWVTEWCGFPITGVLTEGTEKSGVYQISCTIPANAVSDNYTLFVGTNDLMGNSGSELSIDFQVSGGSSDNRTPTVTKIELPNRVSRGESFTVSVSATDESSVVGIYAWFALEGGWISDGGALYAPYSEARFITQTQTEAVTEQDVVFDQNAPYGTYRIWLSIRDGVGNRDFYATESTITLGE